MKRKGERGISYTIAALLTILVLLAITAVLLLNFFKFGRVGSSVTAFMAFGAQLTTKSFTVTIQNTGTVPIKKVNIVVRDTATGKVVYSENVNLRQELGIELLGGQALEISCTPSNGQVQCQWCIGGKCSTIGSLNTDNIVPGDTYAIDIKVTYTNGLQGFKEVQVIAST